MNVFTSRTACAAAQSAVTDCIYVHARQAVFNASHKVIGYELFNRSCSSHTAASDARMLFSTLSCVATDALTDWGDIFINCTHESLACGHLELVCPDRVILEIPCLHADATPAQIAARVPFLEALSHQGFRLAFDQNVLRRAYMPWLPIASFIKLDMQCFALQHACTLIQFVQTHSPAKIVAHKVETPIQLEHMRKLGVPLFQGFSLAQPEVMEVKVICSSRASILRLLRFLRHPGTATQVETALKQDPILLYNLLRTVQNSGLGASCPVTSAHQAMQVLGQQRLLRWASLLLAMPAADIRNLSPMHTALVRGRFMELLASEVVGMPCAEHAFVVGVFSLLDQLLGVPVNQALRTISIDAHVHQALSSGSGIYAPLLQLVQACERCDEASFAHHCQSLCLSSHQVNCAHLQALAWADEAVAVLH